MNGLYLPYLLTHFLGQHFLGTFLELHCPSEHFSLQHRFKIQAISLGFSPSNPLTTQVSKEPGQEQRSNDRR